MKALTPLYALCCCLLPFICKAQFQDDFSDNNLSHNPIWDGEITKFEVLNNQLHLNAPAERSEAHLYTSSEANDSLTFSCDVFLGFNPSSSNYARIDILADTLQNGNGLWLLIGNSNDAVQLYQRKLNKDSLLIELNQALNTDSIALNIQLYFINDTLSLLLKDLQNDTVLMDEYISYTAEFESQIFSLSCHYTSTRSKKFYFDNLSLFGRKKLIKSRVTDAVFLDQQRVLLELDKAPKQNLETPWITLNQIGCDSIYQNNTSIECYWNKPFANQSTHLLEIAENPVLDTLNLSIQLTYGLSPAEGQLLLTELMVDPSPSFGLPEVEYLELYNNSTQTLNLKGIYINGKQIEEDALVAPSELLVLSRDAIPGVANNLVISSLPKYWLANEKGSIEIENSDFEPIYHLNYNKYWHSASENQEGGVSLELQHISPDCYNHAKMWSSSLSPNGGSPGGFIDRPQNWREPELLWFHQRSDGFELSFNNPIKELTENPDNYDWVYVSERHTVFLHDTLSVEKLQLKDCSGQLLELDLPRLQDSDADMPDLIFNEVMYDTDASIPEYIELVNVGTGAVNLSHLNFKIGFSSPSSLDTAQRMLLPGSYALICKDSTGLKNMPRYNSKSVILSDAISLSNSGALLQVLNKAGDLLDEFHYDDSHHFSAYQGTKNIALERIHEGREAPWTSASAQYGGSPGQRNTQFSVAIKESGLQLSSAVITPNSDGHLDFCSLYFNDLQVNSSVSVYIFDNMGNKVMDLVEEEIPGTDAVYQWNGENNLGIPVISGIYLLVAKINSIKGEELFRKSVTVLYP